MQNLKRSQEKSTFLPQGHQQDSQGKGFLLGIYSKENGAWFFWGLMSEIDVVKNVLLSESDQTNMSIKATN